MQRMAAEVYKSENKEYLILADDCSGYVVTKHMTNTTTQLQQR